MNIALLSLVLILAEAAAPNAAPAPEQPAASAESAAVPAASPAATPEPATPGAAPPSPAAAPAEEAVEEVVDFEEADPTAGWYFGEGYTEHTRILALPSARSLRKNSWEFLIDHRASKPFYDGSWEETAHSLGGMDSSLSVGLALRYGICGWSDVGFYRKGDFSRDVYEFDGRFQILKQETMGVDLAVRAGLTWFAQLGKEDASGFYGQLLVDRVIANRLLVGAGLFFHSSSTNGDKYKQDTEYSLAIPAFLELRLTASLGLAAEVVTTAGTGYYSKYPAYSAGIKYFTNRHTFAFVFGNTAELTSDGYITQSQKGLSDSVIGFNLTREY